MGEDLATYLERKGQLDPNEIAEIMLPVCAALAAAHAKGVVHGDLDPSKIGLSVDPKTGRRTALPRRGRGTERPNYLAPEQVAGSRGDAASDQYALGAILHQCATGKRPFDRETPFDVLRAIANGELEPLHLARPLLPDRFTRVVSRAMSLEKEQRFSSVRELGAALLPFAGYREQLRWQSVFNDVAARAGSESSMTNEPVRAQRSLVVRTIAIGAIAGAVAMLLVVGRFSRSEPERVASHSTPSHEMSPRD
jgi:serine/threonine protein kinase